MTRQLPFVALVMATAVVAACGGGSSSAPAASPAATPAATPNAQTAAQSLQQMAQGLSQSGAGTAKLVEYEVLKALMPEASGWTRTVKGDQISMGIASISHAEGTYEKGDTHMKIEITDAALNQLVLTPLSVYMATGFSERNDDGYTKAITIAGVPGFEKWEKDEKHAEVTAIVANRFVVAGESHGLDSADDIRKLVESVNLSKLATLK